MRRVLLGALFAGVLAAITYGILSVTAFDSENDGTSATGKKTLLRIRPVSNEVSCDSIVAVDVFLDDLESKVSPNDPRFGRGLFSFDITLRFNPSILNIEEQLDIELNPDLSREDPDADGRGQSFITLPITPDNFEGTVYVGAVGVPAGWPENPQPEEGPDPVAKGEPILLFTVRFRAVGEGISELGIAWPPADATEGQRRLALDLLDFTSESYATEVQESRVTVRGGSCPKVPTATPRPRPTPTTEPVPATPEVIPTPYPVEPTLAAAGGRPDCDAAWNVYADPAHRLSVCYPSEWTLVEVQPGGGLGGAFSIQNFAPRTIVDNAISITVAWHSAGELAGLQGAQCKSFEEVWGIPVEKVQVDVGGIAATGCQGIGSSFHGGEDPLELLVLTPTGVIEIFVLRTGPNVEQSTAASLDVLDTVRFEGGQGE